MMSEIEMESRVEVYDRGKIRGLRKELFAWPCVLSRHGQCERRCRKLPVSSVEANTSTTCPDLSLQAKGTRTRGVMEDGGARIVWSGREWVGVTLSGYLRRRLRSLTNCRVVWPVNVPATLRVYSVSRDGLHCSLF